MLRRVILSSKTNAQRSFSSNTLVATETFPLKDSVSPQKAALPVFSESKLSNGIKLITKDVPNAKVVTIKFAILGGCGTETDAQKGAAHLLSVGAFAGNSHTTGLKIVRALEEAGAKIKSTVDREKITYDVTVMPDAVKLAVDTVLSSITSPPYAEYVLDELKPTAKHAYASFDSNYEAQVSDLIHEAAFGEVSALGAPMHAPNIAKLSMADVLDYRNTHFVANNIVITASGISTKELEAIVNNTDVKTGTGIAPAASPYVGGDVRVRKDCNGKTFMGVGFPVPAGEASKPYSVLAEMLSAPTSVNNYSSGGLLSIYANGSPDDAKAKMMEVIGELKNIAKGASNVPAFSKKVALKGMLALDGENVNESLLTASNCGVSATSIADARKVDGASVSAAAAACLKAVPSYAVLGKTAGAPSYADIKSSLN